VRLTAVQLLSVTFALAFQPPPLLAGTHTEQITAAAEAMRRILIESVRRKASHQRGGNWQRIDVEECLFVIDRAPTEMLDVDAALIKLAREDPGAAELVKLRYFAGLTLPEASEVLNISPRSADRLWAYARSWLREELEPEEKASVVPERQQAK